jgi:hypothetical protein
VTDFLLPPDLSIAAATPNLDANTASFKSPTVGSTRSVERLGDALRFQFNFSTVNDNPATARKRGRLQAFLSGLRGQSGRVWMTPPGATLRGSFSAPELFANNDFSNGTSGWSTDAAAQYTIAAIDRGVRATRVQVTTNGFGLLQTPSLLAGTPYAIRGFVSAGAGSLLIDFGIDAVGQPTGAIAQGMLEAAFTNIGASSPRAGFFDPSASGVLAGNYFDAKWASLSRCAQVDNGVNLLLFSDTPGTTSPWTVLNATAGSASALGPDGNTVAWALNETATTSTHLVSQGGVIPAAAADYTASFLVKAGNRNWCYIQISDGTNNIFQWFNVSTGALGTFTGGTNFTLIGALCIDRGNGWKRCFLTFRKGSASTALGVILGSATGDAVSSFLGVASPAALLTWRASLAPSSVTVLPAQTTASALPSGTLQTGLQLNLKGLPLSSQGLLLPGDYIECGLQLNQIASPLDSDASGLGTAILTRPPRNSPADGTGFVVNNPMGRFLVTSNSTAWNEQPGRLSDASIELIEDISF